MDIALFAGITEQCRLHGDPACSSDIDALGNDFSQGQYFVETNKSPPINLLFAALFDLIICRTNGPSDSLRRACAVEGHDVEAIFAKKVPNLNPKDDKSKKWLVGAIGGSD